MLLTSFFLVDKDDEKKIKLKLETPSIVGNVSSKFFSSVVTENKMKLKTNYFTIINYV